MKRKPLTKKELLAAVDARLTTLRNGYRQPDDSMHAQIRECMQHVLGQITAMDDVRMILAGSRRSFINQ